MKKAIVASLAVLAGVGLGLAAAPAWSRAAPALSEVRVFKVESDSCGAEAIPERATRTRCEHRGPHIKVYVMEVGLGSNPRATFDGAVLSGSSTAVCQVGSISQLCSGAGVLMGYVYVFDLNGKAQGTFRYSNTSINVPRNTLTTLLSVR